MAVFDCVNAAALDLRAFLGTMTPETVAVPILQAELKNGLAPGRVLCLGKAAPSLARAAASLWPGVPGLLYGTAAHGLVPGGFHALYGEHPFPTEENVARTGEVRRWLEAREGLLLAMVSGGTSSLLVEPRPPFTLDRKLAIVRKLWREGAAIREVNVVRARLSSVKCGGLLSSVDGTAVTAIWSDVGPRDAPLVGSGPTVPWKRGDGAEEILERYGRAGEGTLPAPKRSARRSSDRWFVLSDAVALRREYAARLEGVGYSTREVACPDGTPAESLAARLAEAFLSPAGRKPRAVVGTGEPSVPVRGPSGRGGRCSHLAALVSLELAGATGGRRWAFVAMATDGVDGTAGGGAVCGSGRGPSEAELRRAIAGRDTGAMWERCGGLLPMLPTGNNLRDIWVLADLGGFSP